MKGNFVNVLIINLIAFVICFFLLKKALGKNEALHFS